MMPSTTALKLVFLALLIAAIAGMLGWLPTAGAQSARGPSASRVQAERAAVDLRQGMSGGEVQKLLGKPWRTALSGQSGAASAPGQGTLRWSYVWSNASSSSSERTLNIDFNASAAEQWTVSGWNWSAY